MKRAIILSHTAMGGDRFCTNVFVGDRQVRLRKQGNQPLTYGDMNFRHEDMLQYWQPGGVIEVPDLLMPPHAMEARRTHPEDTIVSPQDITTLYTGRCPEEEFARIINKCRAQSLEDLFPGISAAAGIWGPEKRYVPADGPRPLKRSVGYIACTSVQLMEEVYNDVPKLRVLAYQGNACIGNFPLNGVQQQAAFRDGRLVAGVRYFNATVRFSLADAWVRRGAEELGPRCYVMVSHIHGIPD